MPILVDHIRPGASQLILRCAQARLHASDHTASMSRIVLTQVFGIDANGSHTVVPVKSWSAAVIAGRVVALATVRETRERFEFVGLRTGLYPERTIQAMGLLERAFGGDSKSYRCRLVSLEGGVFSAVCLYARRRPRPYVVVADRRLLGPEDLKVDRSAQDFWARARAAAAHSARKTNVMGESDLDRDARPEV